MTVGRYFACPEIKCRQETEGSRIDVGRPSGGQETGSGVRGGSIGASVRPWPEAPCDECDGCSLGSGAKLVTVVSWVFCAGGRACKGL